MEAVLALGNELKSDDAVGKYVVDKLKKKTDKLLVYGGIAPENCLFRFKGKSVSRLYIVDAADFNSDPGDIKILEGGQSLQKARIAFTHSTNLKFLIKVLQEMIGVQEVFIILIQVKRLGFGRRLSAEVKAAADQIVRFLSWKNI